jgi:SPP1 gp7 family putative phage head morphogenesis protein
VAKKFGHPTAAEKRYARQLRKVAKHSGAITTTYTDPETGLIANSAAYGEAMLAYSQILEPWATRIANEMLAGVNTANLRGWRSLSTRIGRELRREYLTTTAGARARALHADQVTLIKSIPQDAAKRAQKLTQEAMLGGRRPDEAAAMIAESSDVSASQATLIARTETAKANATFTAARASDIGSTHYIWRTMQDEAVRPSHADMEDGVYAFDDPPYVDGEGNHGPGEIYNCRCYAEPIIPGLDDTEIED